MNDTVEVTRLLHDAQAGDPAALNEALRQMYDALRGIARAQLSGEQMERTLSATALVNEAYLKVFGGSQPPDWASRRHLLGVAARAMREVLVDSARRRNAAKRPQEADRLQLTEISMELSDGVDYGALVECLDMLATLDRRQADIVAMRFFMGMSVEQIAMAMEISSSTVQREWRLARAWLQRELGG
ncbi:MULTISPECIES: ECF-type sigma factor [Rhodanobacter]|uniref:Sigma-70 family RNA polymerase sigma factor n=1 Tax=Rhodanobacter hydrolyticus TaxID=2250595 RepID=A0ABW8JA26_9GAMM|nr:ECF-type sigma factor [Rhodanobacter sp. 7MK24]MBD8880379.1 sigma-70 family RNA polymerase sigma factor [Rhodanobacter sp. 7MK24]